MALARISAVLAVVGLLSAVVAGCGMSKEDADVRCDQDKAAMSACFNEEVYAACEACFMQCGDGCDRSATCPATYTCAGDTSADAGNVDGAAGK